MITALFCISQVLALASAAADFSGTTSNREDQGETRQHRKNEHAESCLQRCQHGRTDGQAGPGGEGQFLDIENGQDKAEPKG